MCVLISDGSRQLVDEIARFVFSYFFFSPHLFTLFGGARQLVDEIGFGADALQILCYRLCHLYCRATRSVSIVPPVYYAHLAAARGKILTGGSDYGGDSETASQVSGGGGGAIVGGPLPVHPTIASTMYWT